MNKHPEYSDGAVGDVGARRWINSKGLLHRFGGPAIEHPNGEKIWYWQGRALYQEIVLTEIFSEHRNCCYAPNKEHERFCLDYGKENFWSPGYSKPRKRT